MRICIYGNSHVSALKEAMDHREKIDGVDVEFYAVPGGRGPNIALHNGRLKPKRPKAIVQSTVSGAEAAGLELAMFDVIVFCGLGLPAHKAKADGHLLNHLKLARFASNPSSGRQLVSEAVMAMCIDQDLREAPGSQGFRLVRSAFPGRLLAITRPLPTRRLFTPRDSTASDLPDQYGDQVGDFLAWYFAKQNESARSIAVDLDAQVVTPPEPFLHAGFTPDEYGSSEAWHMNKFYGQLMLDRTLAVLGYL